MIFGALQRHKRRTRQPHLRCPSKHLQNVRPVLEVVEDRVLLSTFTWSGNLSSEWSNPGNWHENGVPGADDIAVFNDTAVQIQSTVDSNFGGNIAGLVVEWTAPNATINSWASADRR